MKKTSDCTELIGRTPLLRLRSVLPADSPVAVYAKIEGVNPGMSVKDRTAMALVRWAEREGLIRPGSAIVESTSGNLGVSLAMICAKRRYRAIIVVDPKMPAADMDVCRALGARLEIVDRADAHGSHQRARIARVKELLAEIPGSVNLDQYNNPAALEAHYETTGPEIYEAMAGEIDALVGSVSTGSHLCGTAKYLKERLPSLHVIATEPEGSVIFGGEPRPYRQRGTGLSFVPGNYRKELVDREVKVSDSDAFETAAHVARNDGILLGGSSGAAIFAARAYGRTLERPASIVVLCPDMGTSHLESPREEA